MVSTFVLQRSSVLNSSAHCASCVNLPLIKHPRQHSSPAYHTRHSKMTRSRVSMAATAVSTVEKATPTPAAPEKLAIGPKIQGRTVVITGGSQGVGKALAKKFAAAGFNVVVAARQADRLHVVAEDLAKMVSGDRGALGIPTDITKAEDVAALAAQVLEKFEDVDVVVNNAGVCLTGPFSATAGEDFRSQMDVNFFGAVAVTTAFLPALKRTAQRRSQSERPVLAIVNSFASRVPLPTMAAYSASKAALASFVDSIRPEMAKSGIHVAQIQPGVISSDFMERAQFRGEKASEIESELKKVLESGPATQTPEQVADVTFNAIMKYKKEVTVGAVFKAFITAHWLGFNPGALLAKSD